MFTEIRATLRDPFCQRTFGRLNFHELLYADDIILIVKSTAMANKIQQVAEESGYYELALSKGRCRHISFNHNANIRFKGGEEMERATAAIYLGANITKNVDPKREIQRRISIALPTLKQLDIS